MNCKSVLSSLMVFLSAAAADVGQADMIDFEEGFARLQAVPSVTTSTNTISFSTEGLDNSPTFIAQVGTWPKDGFENRVDGVVIGDSPTGGNPASSS